MLTRRGRAGSRKNSEVDSPVAIHSHCQRIKQQTSAITSLHTVRRCASTTRERNILMVKVGRFTDRQRTSPLKEQPPTAKTKKVQFPSFITTSAPPTHLPEPHLNPGVRRCAADIFSTAARPEPRRRHVFLKQHSLSTLKILHSTAR